MDSFEEKIRKFTEQLAQDPKSRVFAPLADLYRQQGRYEEAIAVAQDGLNKNPHYVGGKMALARAQYEYGEAAAACSLLEDVVRTAPDNILANRILAEIYTQQDAGQKAVPVLKRLLAMEPSDEKVKAQLAELERSKAPATPKPAPEPLKQQPVSAPVKTPQEAPKEQVLQPTVRTAKLAEVYRAQGHFRQAADVYRELLTKEPNNETYRSQLAAVERAMKPAASQVARMQTPVGLLEMLLKRIEERRRTT